MNAAIYEFSTGINIQTDRTGNWWSVGYLGGWMYNTYDSENANNIPQLIQQAHDNQEFAVADTNQSQFTAIGRIINQNNETWSVVAFLTYAKDEKERRVSTYRFFFSKGITIIEILRRIITFEAQHNTLPVFDPIGATDLNQYPPADFADINSLIPNNSNLELEVKEFTGLKTHVLPENACLVNDSHALSLFNLHRLSMSRAKAIREVGNTAWAYKADVLQRPETFILIQAANENAYKRLLNFDESTMRSVIRGLIADNTNNQDIVNHLQILNTAIKRDPKFTENYLFSLGLPRTHASLNPYINEQSQPELIKLSILLSLFFPHISAHLQQWQNLAQEGWLDFIRDYTAKLKGGVYKANLTNLLQDNNNAVRQYTSGKTSYNPPDDYISWVLTKSLWSNPSTHAIYNQEILQPLSIQTALRELTISDEVGDHALHYLKDLDDLLQNTEIDEQYIRGIAETLGFNEYNFYNHTTPQLIRLHILLSFFFPKVPDQIAQWHQLSDRGFSDTIIKYTSQLKNYINTSNLQHRLQDYNREIIRYCSEKIDFYSNIIEPNKTVYLGWLLTYSLWANSETLNWFEGIIRDHVEESEKKEDSNYDGFRLRNYFIALRNSSDIGKNYQFTMNWKLWQFYSIYNILTETNNLLREINQNRPQPEIYYHQLVDILGQLKNQDPRFQKMYRFFDLINQSREGLVVSFANPEPPDIFDRLQSNQPLVKSIKSSQYLAIFNLNYSITFYTISFFVAWGLGYILLYLTIELVSLMIKYSHGFLIASLFINLILATILVSKNTFRPPQ
jgi:hypothetical protein